MIVPFRCKLECRYAAMEANLGNQEGVAFPVAWIYALNGAIKTENCLQSEGYKLSIPKWSFKCQKLCSHYTRCSKLSALILSTVLIA